jgi:hypothetical protein
MLRKRYTPDSSSRTTHSSFLHQPTPVPESPDTIMQSLMETEKEISAETRLLMQSRHVRERGHWEKIYAEKERELQELKVRLADAEAQMVRLQAQNEQERAAQTEQLQVIARDQESRQKAEKKKWEVVADEVRGFRDSEAQMHAKYLTEQEKAAQAKKAYAALEQQYTEQGREKDEELFRLKEKLVAREEASLQARGQAEKDLSAAEERYAKLQQELLDEREYQSKLIGKRDTDLARLQSALQDVIIQLNSERNKVTVAEQRIKSLEEQLHQRDEEVKASRESLAQEKAAWEKQCREEQAHWQRQQQEAGARSEIQAREAHEQVVRAQKAVALLEQQVTEETRARKEGEEKLALRDHELQNLQLQKDQMAAEWKNMAELEAQNWQKRIAEALAETENLRRQKNEEFAALSQQISAKTIDYEEARRHIIQLQEELRQVNARLESVGAIETALREQVARREAEWKETVQKEEALFKQQVDDLSIAGQALVKARDEEINRLNAELRGQSEEAAVVRQKYAVEKQENAARLGRLQDLEGQIKLLTQRHSQENLEWENKYKAQQSQWESHRSKIAMFESDVENIYQKDIQMYRDKIKKLNAKVVELQQKLDALPLQEQPRQATAAPQQKSAAPALPTPPPAPARPAPQAPEKPPQPGTPIKANKTFYPGK